MRDKKKAKHKKKLCDPGICDECMYIGDGDFLCDKCQAIVVSDWEPTDDYMICRRCSDEQIVKML